MGRPKGSKNKSTLEKERLALKAGTAVAPVKRGRGRPKGSTNKPKAQPSRVAIEFDKHDQVFQQGEKIGHIEYDDGVFIGINERTQRRSVAYDYDLIVAWFKGEYVRMPQPES